MLLIASQACVATPNYLFELVFLLTHTRYTFDHHNSTLPSVCHMALAIIMCMYKECSPLLA